MFSCIHPFIQQVLIQRLLFRNWTRCLRFKSIYFVKQFIFSRSSPFRWSNYKILKVYTYICVCVCVCVCVHMYVYVYIIYTFLSVLEEKAMAPHSSTLAWKIPWMEEPGRLQSMGLQRVKHDWVASLSRFTFMDWRRKWQPTLVSLPGESQGRDSPGGLPSMGSHRVLAATAAA